MIDSFIIEIYNLSDSARDGFSGALNFSVLLDIAKSKGMTDFDDLLYYANECEKLINKKRSKNKNK